MTKVVILGGGVAGMSAAHELLERGYQVEVYDLGDLPGGKAKSMYHGPPGPNNRRLPAEHGFRFFPGWYQHIDDTMERIDDPFNETEEDAARGGRKVIENLTRVSEVGFASYQHAPLMMLSRLPRNLQDLKLELSDLFGHHSINFGHGELEFYATKLWQILTSGYKRRLGEYEKIGWWDFIEAEGKSDDYQKYLGNLPRMLVAADPRTVSTKTNGDILLQTLMDIGRVHIAADRVLQGPTNEMWLFPWMKQLLEMGMKYYINAEVTRIHTDGGRVSGATVTQVQDPIRDKDDPDATYLLSRVTGADRYAISSTPLGETELTVSGDYYIAAMPVEAFAKPGLVGRAKDDPDNPHPGKATGLIKLDPTLASIPELAKSVDWMSGMLVYLKKGAGSVPGHIVYVDPETALTSIAQKQYWPNIKLSEYGDGETADILSMDISDWTKGCGREGKPLEHYDSRTKVIDEVWQDAIDSFANGSPGETLKQEDRHDAFLDPAIQYQDPSQPEQGFINRTPLLVNKVNTWSLRPEAYTRIPNFFLAGDYVRTNTDLATMEGANEAARRAVNALLEAQGSTAGKCRVYQMHEPVILAVFRWYDNWRYDRGLPYKNELPLLLKPLHAIWQWLRNHI